MKIIVLGGAGDMGSRAVRELAREPGLERLTIADTRLEAAATVADGLRPVPLDVVQVDARDHATLVAAIRGHDVAAGAIGPFYVHEAPVAAAAIEAGVPYVSICDDYDGARAALALDARARAAGVPVLTGMGWTPGLSNVLARRAADELDEVDTIDVAWGGSASDSEGFAVILHTIHIMTGRVPSFRDGREVEVEAGSGRRPVRFPEPVGEIEVFHVGHPEPVTLPRFVKGVRTVTLRGGLSERPLNHLGIWLGKMRLTDTARKKQRLGKVIELALPALSRLGRPLEPCSAIRVDVHGRSEGRERTISYGAAGHMADLTAVPLAVGALMLARGEIRPIGATAPEACVPPDAFLTELARRGIEVLEMAHDRPLALRAPAGERIAQA